MFELAAKGCDNEDLHELRSPLCAVRIARTGIRAESWSDRCIVRLPLGTEAAVSGIVVLVVVSLTWVLFFGGIWMLIRSRRTGATAAETSPPVERPE